MNSKLYADSYLPFSSSNSYENQVFQQIRYIIFFFSCVFYLTEYVKNKSSLNYSKKGKCNVNILSLL